MMYNDYDKNLGALKYKKKLGRVINLLDENECSKYGVESSKLDLPDFILEFAGLQQDKAIFEEPTVLETKIYKVGKFVFRRVFNIKKVYQANTGRVILTKINESDQGGLSKAKPVGWKYNFIVSPPPRQDYFYHRTHILGNQLIENKASYGRGEYFLGTRFLNAAPTGKSMITYENRVREWFDSKEVDKVFYRVTPVFREGEILPRGVRMSAIGFRYGKESSRFDVFILNIYPGYRINYSTGSVSTKRRLGFSTIKRKNTHENRR